MGQFLQDGENGQNVAFFWSSAVTKQFDFFNFSQLFLFCPLDSKNVFVLVLTHLEPELELFEVWEIMVLQSSSPSSPMPSTSNSSSSGSR